MALTAYLVNGGITASTTTAGKTTGFSFAWTPNQKVSLIDNCLVGPEASNFNGTFRHPSDTVLTYSPTAKLSLMANYDYGQDHFVDTTVGAPITGPMAHGIVQRQPKHSYGGRDHAFSSSDAK